MKIPELEALKSDRFILWVAIFTLPLLSSNTYFVYHKISVFTYPYKELVSVGVSFVLASFILIYTIRKNYRMAKYYSYFEALISAYYYIMTIGWDWPLLPAMGFVLILPASLYHSAKEIEKEKEEKKESNVDDTNKNETISALNSKIIQLNTSVVNLENEKKDIRSQANNYIINIQEESNQKSLTIEEQKEIISNANIEWRDEFSKELHLESSSEVSPLQKPNEPPVANKAEESPKPLTDFWYNKGNNPVVV